MAADGSITFSTALDNDQLEKDLKKAEQDVARLEKRVNSSTAKRSALEEEMDGAQRAIEAASKATEELRTRLEWLRSFDISDEHWSTAQVEIKQLTAQLQKAEAEEAKLGANNEKLEQKWAEANKEVRQHEQELAQATSRARELGEEYQRAYSGAGPAIRQGMQQASDGFARLGDRINGMVRRVFMLQVALSALRGVRGMLSEALMKNQQLNASVEALRASFQGLVNFVAGAVAPAIVGMANTAIAAISTLARIVDSLFGTDIVASIQAARDAAEATWRQAQASDAAAGAAKDQAKATKAAGKEAERAAKSVMGFDELNQLSDNGGSGSGGGGGGVPGGGGALAPDWDALDVGKIGEKLAEVMIILGSALMAVGAILAFSGINIPLGLTLMAIGALMVYTAYRERWDELPQRVKEAITTALALAGVVLVVLGAVLAFSGINIPLGIGLMAAGLTLLGVATALNWASLSQQLKATISTALAVVGIVAVVVGAVLAFSGANLPLGIGLMALGALAIGTVGVLNWDVLKNSLRQVLTKALELVGIIAVVIGAVLAFTGTNIPVGIGLMALGAAAMMGSVALSWEHLKGDLNRVISKTLELVGIVAVVVGAVLSFSGVNVPLGIGLMAAGALAMGGSVVLNWDQLKDKVSSVLSTLLKLAGAVALAIGAVIALSGVNLPLGIGLIAAGALALASSAALNWDKMPDQVRTTVGIIAGIAGAALLVLGIILCLSGFGVPLGVALVLAGASGLVTAAKLNWGFFGEKAREIWGNLVSWFNSSVKPKFTAQYWASLFFAIVSGIRSAINDAMRAFNDFVSWLTMRQSIATGLVSSTVSGISSGISATISKINIKIPQINIPHLASGAVLPPNREFMAVLGDQRSGNNIEAPEALMRQVVREEAGAMMADALRAAMAGGMGGQQGGDVVLMVGRRELARAALQGVRELRDTGELRSSGSGLVFV